MKFDISILTRRREGTKKSISSINMAAGRKSLSLSQITVSSKSMLLRFVQVFMKA